MSDRAASLMREQTTSKDDEKIQRLSESFTRILETLGEDVHREGLQKTPMRAAKAYTGFTKGYDTSLEEIVNGALFEEDLNEMVVVRDIAMYSLCEHHLVPFIGRVHIGYIPNGTVIGLSKLARIVEMFARRFQVQERMTRQIADAIHDILSPKGVAVVTEATYARYNTN